MRLFATFIVLGLVFMIVGVAIAMPADDTKTVLQGSALVWLALLCIWTASKVQPR